MSASRKEPAAIETDIGCGVFGDDVVGAAFDDGGGGDDGQLCFFPEFGDAQRTAVAHGGPDFGERRVDAVFQGTGIGEGD